jgi:hypothetical protein
MNSILAVEIDESLRAVLISQGVLILGAIGKLVWDWWANKKVTEAREQDRLDREEDRKDRAQLAEFTAEQLELVRVKGDERIKKIVEELIKTRQVNIAQIKSSNAFNKKLDNLTSAIAESPLVVSVEKHDGNSPG